jgi:hypothetical protein
MHQGLRKKRTAGYALSYARAKGVPAQCPEAYRSAMRILEFEAPTTGRKCAEKSLDHFTQTWSKEEDALQR